MRSTRLCDRRSVAVAALSLLALLVVAAGAPVDSAVSIGSAPGEQIYVSLAATDSGFFAVWEDTRAGSTQLDIYGTAFDRAGTAAVAAGVPIAEGPEEQHSPVVACASGVCLAAWVDKRLDGIYAARFDEGGRRLDATALLLEPSAGDPRAAVSAMPSGFVVAFTDGAGVLAKTVSLQGVVGAATRVTVAVPSRMSAIGGTTRHLVAWSDGSGYYTRALDPTGALAGGITRLSSGTAERSTSLAVSPVGFGALWEDFSGAGGSELYFARLAADGTLIDPGGLSVASMSGGTYALGWQGETFQVVWSRSYSGQVDHFTIDLDAGTTPSAVLAPALYERAGLAMAFTADAGLVLYSRYSAPSDLAAVTFQPFTDSVAVRSANGQRAPAVSFAPGGSLVAWEHESDDVDVRAAIVGDDGRVAVGAFDLATGPGHQRLPAASHDGVGHVLAWVDEPAGSVMQARASAQGLVSPAGGRPLTTGLAYIRPPRVASGPLGSVVVWSYYTGVTSNDLMFSVIGLDNTPTGAPTQFVRVGYDEYPAIAYGNQVFVIAYSSDEVSGVAVLRLSAAGVLLDLAPIAVSINFASNMRPAVASDGTDFLVAWFEQRRLLARHVTAQGTLPEPAPLELDPAVPSPYFAYPHQLTAAFDDSSYVVSYPTVSADAGSDIVERRVFADSGVSAPSLRAGGVGDQDDLSVSRPLYAWSEYEPATGALRVRFTLDGGAVGDGGTLPGIDGGPTSSPRRYPVGCGCRASPLEAWLLVAVLGRLAHRRRAGV